MKKVSVFAAAIRDRRRAWIWWTLSLLLTALMIAGSYGAIKGQEELNKSFENIPESLKVLMGIDEDLLLTSPAGYLNSQWFANFFPILLSIYGIGVASRMLAGEEGDGRLELLLAHPVARLRVLGERWAATVLMLVGLFAVAAGTVVAAAPAFDITGIGLGPLTAASASAFLLALLHTAITYGVGAWSGRRGLAIAVGSAVTGGGFLVQSLAGISETLQPFRWLSPWYWFVEARPVVDGWGPMVLPTLGILAACAAVVVAGAWRFRTRDIGIG